MTPTIPDIDAIEKRLDAATAGPWSAKAIAELLKVGQEHLPLSVARETHDQLDADALFISMARNGDLRSLIAYARGMKEALVARDAEIRTLRNYGVEASKRNDELTKALEAARECLGNIEKGDEGAIAIYGTFTAPALLARIDAALAGGAK